MQVEFTETEQKIMNVLSDGNCHLMKELQLCLYDTLSPSTTVHVHLTAIRNKLRPIGQNISTTYQDGVFYYRHVRMIAATKQE